MNLESKKVTVEKTASYIFNALIDVTQYEKLMPENIAKFEVTAPTDFIFGLKGMPEIKLRLKEQTPNSIVKLGAASDKLPFSLTATIDTLSDESCAVQLFLKANLMP